MSDDDDVPQQSRDRSAQRSLSSTMTMWAPVAAGVIRAAAGVLAFAASLLTLPIHFATPFLSGVVDSKIAGSPSCAALNDDALPAGHNVTGITVVESTWMPTRRC